MTYKVRFVDTEGVKRSRRIDACNPGHAFALAQKSYPKATMIEAIAHGARDDGFTIYEPPKIQRDPVRDPRPPREPKPDELGCEFGFYNEVIGERR